MKRIIIICLLVMFSSFMLSGCSDILPDQNNTQSNNNSGGGNSGTDGDGSGNSGGGNSGTDGDGNGNSGGGNSGTDGDGSDNGTGGDENGDDNSYYLEIKFECNPNGLDVVCNITDEKISENVDIIQYYWDFGEEKGMDTGKGPKNYTYSKAGTYDIALGVFYELKDGSRNTKEIGSQKVEVGEIPPPSEEIKHLFDDTFGQKTEGMYFAIHFIGETANPSPVTGLGLFAQKGDNVFGKYEAYARDLVIQMKGESGATKYQFSTLYEQMGLTDIYSKEYGWTDSTGMKLDVKFYFGLSKFYMSEQSKKDVFYFENFAIQDLLVGGMGGSSGFDSSAFVRCNTDYFNVRIPANKLNEFNQNMHINIALFTVKFTDTCTYTVTFDGFVEK